MRASCSLLHHAFFFYHYLILDLCLQVHTELRSSFLKRMIFNMGMRAKESEIKKSIVRINSVWDKIVFRKIQESMGGRLRLMLVGSAPLAANVLTFTRCALGCVVVEGYGQTECSAPITLTIQVRIFVSSYDDSVNRPNLVFAALRSTDVNLLC